MPTAHTLTLTDTAIFAAPSGTIATNFNDALTIDFRADTQTLSCSSSLILRGIGFNELVIEVTGGPLNQFVPDVSYTCFIVVNNNAFTWFSVKLSNTETNTKGVVYSFSCAPPMIRVFDRQLFCLEICDTKFPVSIRLVPASKNNKIIDKESNRIIPQPDLTAANITPTFTLPAGQDLVTFKATITFHFTQIDGIV